MLYSFCALRRNEALHLTRGMVELERGLLHIRGKGDKGRIVPIVDEELKERLAEACIHYPRIRRGKQVDKNDKIRPKRNDEYLFISVQTGKPGQKKGSGLGKSVCCIFNNFTYRGVVNTKHCSNFF